GSQSLSEIPSGYHHAAAMSLAPIVTATVPSYAGVLTQGYQTVSFYFDTEMDQSASLSSFVSVDGAASASGYGGWRSGPNGTVLDVGIIVNDAGPIHVTLSAHNIVRNVFGGVRSTGEGSLDGNTDPKWTTESGHPPAGDDYVLGLCGLAPCDPSIDATTGGLAITPVSQGENRITWRAMAENGISNYIV